MKLRDYQSEAVAAAHASWQDHDRSMLVLPTGMGKTEIFVDVAKTWAEAEREANRVLVVAPMIELVSQAARKLRMRTGVDPGIEQGQQRSNEYLWGRSPFIVGSKQTLCGKSQRFRRFEEVGLVVVDECHLAATKQYAEMLDHFVDQGAKVLGVTATPKRHDGKAMANLFDTCPFEMYIADAVPLGWLVPPVAQCVQIKSLDLSAVGTKGTGDFKDKDLARVMEDERVIYEIAEVTARESVGLKTVVFCGRVHEAKAVAHRLVDHHGIRAEWICGDKQDCSDERRSAVLNSFTQDPRGVQVVLNVGVLTTGWDFPGLEHIVMARPTKSEALYTQMFGRGTRPLAGVVDFEGSTPELRRAAIAASAKPTFKVTDLYDNSLEHKLVGSANVMGGKMGLDVVEKARERMLKQGGPADVDQALADAKRDIEDEKQRKRRAAIASKAEYASTSVDPLDPDQRAPGAARKPSRARMPFGKYKGSPVSAVDTGYLQWGLRNGVFRTQWLKQAVLHEIAERGAGARPTPPSEQNPELMANQMLAEH